MDLSLTAVYSALAASQQALELKAQDLANAQTPGYRPQSPYFQSAYTVSRNGGNDEQIPWGVKLESGPLSSEAGPIQGSQRPWDLALEDPQSFFCIETPAGERYTRDGSFHFDAQGRLVTAQGFPVLGQRGPLLAEAGLAKMESDGRFRPQTGFDDQLRLAQWKGGDLLREGHQLFRAAPNAEVTMGKSKVLTRSREGSGVDVFQGMADLVMLMRYAESVQKAARASDDANGELLRAAKL